MRSRQLLIAFGPLVVGFATGFFLEQSNAAPLVITGQYLFDVPGLVSRAGILLTATLFVFVLIRQRVSQRIDAVRTDVTATNAKEQRRFLQRLDHELKNPLTIMRLGLINLRSISEFKPDQRASIVRIEQQTQRLEKLLVDLRLLTELQERTLEKQPLKIGDIIQDALADCAPGRQNREFDINIQVVPWPVGMTAGDRELLVLALRNLFDNSIKFTESGGQIAIRVTDDGHNITIEIADDGIGIPPQDIPYVFDELYRGHNASRLSGSGLGLTLVQQIVQLHTGTITLNSRENQGSVVTIRLPLA